EQWFGDGPGITALDHRTDIYALGCTLYELLSGRPPFVGRTTTEMRSQHLHDAPPPLYVVAPQVPQPVSRVIMRALAKDRDERQQTAAQFIAELRAAYDENFQNTEQKLTRQLRITQESADTEPDENNPNNPGNRQQSASLTDTEESVPMFLEKLTALNPDLLRIEAEPEAAPELEDQAIAAGDDTPPAEEQADALPITEEMPAPDGSTTPHDGQLIEAQPSPIPPAAPVAKRTRRRLFVITGIVLLLAGAAVAAGLGLYLHRTRQRAAVSQGLSPPRAQFKPPQIPMSALVGTLRISAPPGSEVFVDDERAGITGADGFFNMQVPVGVRNVRVAAKGYRLWLKDATVRANQKTLLSAARERVPEIAAGTAEQLEKRAAEAAAKKEYETAEASYRQLLKDDPDNIAAHAQLGIILNQEQRYVEAIEELETDARLDPKEIDARESLVRLYLMKGRDDEAETTARQLVRLAPREAAAHHWLARALLRDPAKLDEAESEIEAALKNRETPELLETKAYILLARSSLDEALAAAERAVELDQSKNSAARAAVAAILFRMERVDEAVSTYRQLRQSEKTDRWGDIKRLEVQRGYSKPVLETLAALIARTN
ncbi:MAG TPA: tetratricopeptide repeat protein, partial [Pyrinomonadaceae bacterium]